MAPTLLPKSTSDVALESVESPRLRVVNSSLLGDLPEYSPKIVSQIGRARAFSICLCAFLATKFLGLDVLPDVLAALPPDGAGRNAAARRSISYEDLPVRTQLAPSQQMMILRH